jgi:hypothetical protein
MESIHRTTFFRSAISVGLLGLFGCASTRQDWIKARVKDTPDGYAQFVLKHPKTPETELAKKKLQEIQAKQEWQTLSSHGAMEECRAFLMKYPQSVLVPDVKKKMDSLEAELAWQSAEKTDTAESYAAYLEKYPTSIHAGPAAQRIVVKDIDSVSSLERPSLGQTKSEFQKSTREEYTRVFRAPNGPLLHDWVVGKIESTGQDIVHGCVAALMEKEGRFYASVNYASPMLWSVGQGGTISPVGRRKPEPAGTISIKYTSDGIEYDFYDSGPDKTTWERMERKSADGRSTVSKAITKNGRYYLKIK